MIQELVGGDSDDKVGQDTAVAEQQTENETVSVCGSFEVCL